MAPLIIKFSNFSGYNVKICITAQHREMLDQILSFFKIKVNYDLNLMKPNQSLFDITINGLKKLEKVLEDCKPSLILVQGDTSTAFLGALAGYYNKIKIAHIEAGLRSNNKYSPFPEEINRILVDHISDYHFAPTINAKNNLNREGIEKNVWVVGNTVIDAILLTKSIISNNFRIEQSIKADLARVTNIDLLKSKIILVTSHRRENLGKPLENICYAVKEISEKLSDFEIIFPVHLNPKVRKSVYSILNNVKKIHLIEPLDYPNFFWLMNKSQIILTDSGGIQEEAPSLGKPILVMRDVTERREGIIEGTAKLVGTNKEDIVRETIAILTNKEKYLDMANAVNPYGNGKTSEKIFDILYEKL